MNVRYSVSGADPEKSRKAGRGRPGCSLRSISFPDKPEHLSVETLSKSLDFAFPIHVGAHPADDRRDLRIRRRGAFQAPWRFSLIREFLETVGSLASYLRCNQNGGNQKRETNQYARGRGGNVRILDTDGNPFMHRGGQRRQSYGPGQSGSERNDQKDAHCNAQKDDSEQSKRVDAIGGKLRFLEPYLRAFFLVGR